MFLPHPRVKVSIVGSLRDREVACSASDRQGSNFESCVWRTVSSQLSHHPQEVLLAQFSLYVHKGGLKPDSFHFIFISNTFSSLLLKLENTMMHTTSPPPPPSPITVSVCRHSSSFSRYLIHDIMCIIKTTLGLCLVLAGIEVMGNPLRCTPVYYSTISERSYLVNTDTY